ncbi:M28 family peptidase [Candidatus Bipolaricaulota bacterium]|nr:M28 family peptidase [Candidatus Bipolaricaulota bacterium]
MIDQVRTNKMITMITWIIIIALGLVAILPLVPPAPGEARDEDFSVERAFEHIEVLAQTPRPMGSPGNANGRDIIVQELSEQGLSPQLQSIRVRNYYSRAGELIDVVNVMVRIPGTNPTGAVLLMGHHDTVPETLGANDNTSAVAILLDVARALVTGAPLRNDVILLFTDGEEPAPRYGSTAFVTEHPWAADIRFVINLEALGSTGTAMLVEMNGSTRWISTLHAQSVPHPAAYSFVTALTELIGGSNTDFATFRDLGVPGIEVAYMIGSPIYHTMSDTPDIVSKRSLYQHGTNALALVRSVGNLDLGVDHGDAEGIFFTVARFVSIRYPTSWSIPLLAIAAILIVTVGCRQRHVLRALLRSALTIGVLVGAALMVGLIWMVLARARSMMGIIESYTYLAAFATVTALLGFAVAHLFKRYIEPSQDAMGVLLVFWTLGLVSASAAPGASFLFVWPSLVGSLILFLNAIRRATRISRLIEWLVLSGITLVLFVPAVDFFYMLAQPRPGNPGSEIIPSIVIPIALIALVIELLRTFHRGLITSHSH